MRSVPVTELKAQLAKYLRLVQKGGEVQVLERGVPIARLVGLATSAKGAELRLERLVALGVVRRGAGELARLVGRPPRLDGLCLGDALAEDRRDRV